ncbi:MAG TPA: hypothetical protein VJY41_09695 [Prolixibacteraceae bacterium]|nr:hypothetical protein [Prolixibacteraceae bacterium]
MRKPFKSDSILYYPTIEFQSETWVKASLTFWNKIYRIVPPHYRPNDSIEIAEAVDGKFIENIELSDADLKDTAESFTKFCEKLHWYPAGFESSTYEVRLHNDKIDTRLKPFFKEFSGNYDREGFYKIPEEIANGYMFFLSHNISRRRNINMLSDNPDMFAAMTYFESEGNFDEHFLNSESEELHTNLMIENLIPKDIRSIKMSTILKISNDLEKSKNEFRDSIAGFAKEFNQIEDSSFAIKEIEKFKEKLQNNKIARAEYLRSYSQNLIPSLIYVGLPVFATSLIGSVFTAKDDIFNVAELFKGVALAGVATFSNAGKDIVKNWNPNFSNYYLDLKTHLTSNEKSNIKVWNISKRLDEYVND